ncbi:hypothetical protein HanXRQr2_Chr17g0786461 [Helianthus annuus]|uniref:Uncharacterized protein n=2 Tax=Helianthus annuus TaxID=4232 RepID=A0A9K3DFJ1_HELAN|nr:hypothetical protein HanXRQr2_Chr17g0786461 [Helianthus annuus]KAJ0811787.1 hypothetical protein HanPSC8_Chr17g0754661 [Helianthus annuus]
MHEFGYPALTSSQLFMVANHHRFPSCSQFCGSHPLSFQPFWLTNYKCRRVTNHTEQTKVITEGTGELAV